MHDVVAKSNEKVQAATMLEPEIYDALAQLAESNERSVAAELRLAIKKHLSKEDT
jgi:hypothetical protein